MRALAAPSGRSAPGRRTPVGSWKAYAQVWLTPFPFSLVTDRLLPSRASVDPHGLPAGGSVFGKFPGTTAPVVAPAESGTHPAEGFDPAGSTTRRHFGGWIPSECFPALTAGGLTGIEAGSRPLLVSATDLPARALIRHSVALTMGPMSSRRHIITFGGFGLLVASVAFAAGLAVDRMSASSPATLSSSSSSSPTPSPTSSASAACLTALEALRNIRDDSSDTFRAAVEQPGRSEESQAETERGVAAALFVIELRLKTLDIPPELATAQSVELEFMRTVRELFETLAAGSSDTDTFIARINALREELDRRLSMFECTRPSP